MKNVPITFLVLNILRCNKIKRLLSLVLYIARLKSENIQINKTVFAITGYGSSSSQVVTTVHSVRILIIKTVKFPRVLLVNLKYLNLRN